MNLSLSSHLSSCRILPGLLLATTLQLPAAHAAEGGMGDYALGLFGPQAGYLPAPGDVVKFDSWNYSGDASISANRQVPCCAGGLTANADVKAGLDMQANILTAMHVFAAPVLNGHAAVAVVLPYVDADLDLKGAATLSDGDPLGRRIAVAGRTTLSDENLGDSIVSSMIGWHADRLHYTSGVNLYLPTGHYDEGKAVNTGRNYWAIEPNAAFTYLNESNGLEFSSSLGMTINRENTYTNYRTGNELHLELAGIQHLSKYLYAGVASYHYDQLTGDSGSGAKAGDFKGKVNGVGPVIGGMVPIDEHRMLVLNARYYHEYGAENRLEGNAFWATAAVSF